MKSTFCIITGLIAIQCGLIRAAPPSMRESESNTKLTETKITKCLQELDKLLVEVKKYIITLGTVVQDTQQSNSSICKRATPALPTKVMVMEFPADSERGKTEIVQRATNRTGEVDENSIRKYLSSLTEFNWVASCLNGGKCSRNATSSRMNVVAKDMAMGSEVVQGNRPTISPTSNEKSPESLEHETPPEPDKVKAERVSSKAEVTSKDARKNSYILQSNCSHYSGITSSPVKQGAVEKTEILSDEKLILNSVPLIIVNGTTEKTPSVETFTNEIKKPLPQADQVSSGVNQTFGASVEPVPDLSVQLVRDQRGNSSHEADELGFKGNSVDPTSKNQIPLGISLPFNLEGSTGQDGSSKLTTTQSTVYEGNASVVNDLRGQGMFTDPTSTETIANEKSALAVEGRSEQETSSNLTSTQSEVDGGKVSQIVGGPRGQGSYLTILPSTKTISVGNSLSDPKTDSLALSAATNTTDYTTIPPFAASRNEVHVIDAYDVDYFKRLIANMKEMVDAVQKEDATQDGHHRVAQPSSQATSDQRAPSKTQPEEVDEDDMVSPKLREHADVDPIHEKDNDVLLMKSQGKSQVFPTLRVKSQNEISNNRILPLTIHMKPVTYNSYYVKRESNSSVQGDEDPKVTPAVPIPENSQAVKVPLIESSKSCGLADSTSCSDEMIDKLEGEYQGELVTRDGTDKRDSDASSRNEETEGSPGKYCESNVYFILGDRWADSLIRDLTIDPLPKQQSYEWSPLMFPSLKSPSPGAVDPLQKSSGVNCAVRGNPSGSSSRSFQSRTPDQSSQRINLRKGDYIPFKGNLDYEASLVNFPRQNPAPPTDLSLKPPPPPDVFKPHDMATTDMMSLGMEMLGAFPLDDLANTRKIINSNEPVYGDLVERPSFPEYTMRKNMDTGNVQDDSTFETHPSPAEDEGYSYFVSGQYVKPHYTSAVSEPLNFDAIYDAGNKNYAPQEPGTYQPSDQSSTLNSPFYDNRFLPTSNTYSNYDTWSDQTSSPVNTGLPYPTQYSSSSYPGGYNMQSSINSRLLMLNRPRDPPYSSFTGPNVKPYDSDVVAQPSQYSSTYGSWHKNARTQDYTVY